MGARHEQYKKPAPTGHLIHVNTSHIVRSDGEYTTTFTSKIPVADLAGATITVVDRLKAESLTVQHAIMKDWLQSISDHKSPTATHKGDGVSQATNEFWYEPFSEEMAREIEEGGGVGTRFSRSKKACSICKQPYSYCICEDTDEDEEDED